MTFVDPSAPGRLNRSLCESLLASLPVPRRHAIPLACALAALASAGAVVVATLHWQSWDTRTLIRMHDSLPLAKLALRDDPSFPLRHRSGFYDGAYFYAIARDP